MPATRTRKSAPTARPRPNLGLVCISLSDECRFKTITRTRFLALPPDEQRRALEEVYWANVNRLHWTLGFCQRKGIRLYRATSALFPLSDLPLGAEVLGSFAALLSSVGRRARALGIRMLLHPDQFVVLNSESEKVAATSVVIMEKHARAFDLMGLPQSPWSCMILHGGKAGRADVLVDAIARLPANVRSRLVLENDEYAYSADDILDVCRRAGVPMVFDAHHHVIKEKLDTYEHESVARLTDAARATWPDPSWQIVHLSNGAGGFLDRNHSEFIDAIPSAYARVPWIEVEARGKECAIARLTAGWDRLMKRRANVR